MRFKYLIQQGLPPEDVRKKAAEEIMKQSATDKELRRV